MSQTSNPLTWRTTDFTSHHDVADFLRTLNCQYNIAYNPMWQPDLETYTQPHSTDAAIPDYNVEHLQKLISVCQHVCQIHDTDFNELAFSAAVTDRNREINELLNIIACLMANDDLLVRNAGNDFTFRTQEDARNAAMAQLNRHGRHTSWYAPLRRSVCTTIDRKTGQSITTIVDHNPIDLLQWTDDNIQNKDDIRLFCRTLMDQYDIAFHPDNSFDDYINGRTHLHVFTVDEAKHLNTLLDACFTLCTANDWDIYQLALDAYMTATRTIKLT